MAWPTEAGALSTPERFVRTPPRKPRSAIFQPNYRIFLRGIPNQTRRIIAIPPRPRSRGLIGFTPYGAFPSGFNVLRIFGSGASVDGGVQQYENGNLGGFRSSTELQNMAPFGAMASITIERVGEANIPGTGTMEGDGTGRFRWTAPGSSTSGPWVYVPTTNSVTLPDGTVSGAGLRVRRTGSPPVAYARAVKVLEIYNNPTGQQNVIQNQRAAGLDVYRALFFQNAGPYALNVRAYLNNLGTSRTVNAGGYASSGAVNVPVNGALDDWPATGFVGNYVSGEVMYYSGKNATVNPTGLTVPSGGRDVYNDVGGGAAGSVGDSLYPIPGMRVALDIPVPQSNGSVQLLTNETKAPTGETWTHPMYESDVNAITYTLNSASMIVLWIHRKVIAGATASAMLQNQLAVDHFPVNA